MLQRALVLLCACSLALFMAGCGQTYSLQSITVSPTSANLYGDGAQQAFVVTANYSNTKSSVVTTHATYQLSLPSDQTSSNSLWNLSSITVNQSGILSVVGAACTWTVVPVTVGTTTTYSYGTDPFIMTVTYKEGSVTRTAKVLVSVNNEAGVCFDGTNTTY